MTIIFVSNILNHHQIPFCEKLYKICDEFYFVATERISSIGYQQSVTANYVLNYFEDKNRSRCEQLIQQADAVIFGSCPNSLIALRMKEHKLSFLYSERFFKKGIWRRFIPTTRKKIIERVVKYKNEPLYVLCASAYTAYDLTLCGFPAEKCFKWGYFPAVKNYDPDLLIQKKHPEKNRLLWAGRFLDWKRPADALKVAKFLKERGYSFHLTMIGAGSEEARLKQLIRKWNLSACVNLPGAMPTEKVREYMEEANIYLFTSNFYEGWGAVLNEAMNSGCAVVAAHSIGSVPFLVKQEENGMIYPFGKQKNLNHAVARLLEHPEEQELWGRRSYLRLKQKWNATVAVERLLTLSNALQNHQDTPFHDDEIASPAPIINNHWMTDKP